MPAPIPPTESARIQALRRYHILDTPPERHLDGLTSLAAHLCGVPVAVISLVDVDRQWFKAKVGTDLQETPRYLAFCAHTILGRDLLVVRDARRDPRFRDNPMVNGSPYIRFYAGMPLLTEDGLAIGSLSIIDHRVRRITHDMREGLHVLSQEVMTHLALRLSVEELTRTHALLETRERQLRRLHAEYEQLAMDLHDGILQSLYGIGLGLETCMRFREGRDVRIAGALRQAIRQLNEVMNEVRRFVQRAETAAHAVPELTLVEEIRKLVRASRETGAARFQTRIDVRTANALPPVQRTDLLQILREAIANSLRHGRPTLVRISLRVLDHSVSLEIADNGSGMKSRQGAASFGLRNMSRRAERLGGTLTVRTSPGQGTRVLVKFPRPAERRAPAGPS